MSSERKDGPPWSRLPVELGPALRLRLDGLVDEVIAAVGTDVPEYRRPIEGSFGVGLRVGVEVALSRFCDLPGTSAAPLSPEEREVYAALGRGELRQGRSLEALLAAYRTGARVAFRHFAADAQGAAVDPDSLITLAEAIFAYIDELSTASVEGFAVEQSERAGERERRRAELVTVLLAGGGHAGAVAELAASVGWPLPAQIQVVLASSDVDALGLALGGTVLLGEDRGLAVGVLGSPRSATGRARLTSALAGRGAVIAPARPWAEVPGALRLARLAQRLHANGRLCGDPVWVEDHLAALLLGTDADLAAELVRRRLAPLDTLRPGTRERLADTLRAWLAHRGERQRVAAALHVHPQTVGYRLGQLRRLFGDALDDPDARFELELALRASYAATAP